MRTSKAYNKKSGITYVYEVLESHWDPELKQPRNTRRLIGKIDPITGELVPTGKRGRRKKPTEADVREMQDKFQVRIRSETDKNSELKTSLQTVGRLFEDYIQTSRETQQGIAELLRRQEALNETVLGQLHAVLNQISNAK